MGFWSWTMFGTRSFQETGRLSAPGEEAEPNEDADSETLAGAWGKGCAALAVARPRSQMMRKLLRPEWMVTTAEY